MVQSIIENLIRELFFTFIQNQMIKSDSKFQNKTFHIIRAYLDIFMMVWYVKIIFYPTNSVLASIIFIIKVFHSKELCNSIKVVEIFQYTVWCSCFHLVLSLSVLNIEPRTWYIHSYNPFLAQNLAKALLFIQTEKAAFMVSSEMLPDPVCLTLSLLPLLLHPATSVPSSSVSWDCVLAAFTQTSPSQSG